MPGWGATSGVRMSEILLAKVVLDLMSMTHHVECVAILEPVGKGL